jgi:transcriptional regulator with XRE-family HTH domain
MGTKRKARIAHDEVVARFAGRLKELRAERGMTQAELARRAKVTPTYLSKLEAAGAAPGIDLVGKLAAALGAGVADLFPPAGPGDPTAVPREQARALFAALLDVADPRTFALLNPFLALLLEASGKRA